MHRDMVRARSPSASEGAGVCPLGLCTTESVCPNAPCLDCMRRLGDHMIEEIKVLQVQARVAQTQNRASQLTLHEMLKNLAKRAQEGIASSPSVSEGAP